MSSCGTVIPWQPYTNNYSKRIFETNGNLSSYLSSGKVQILLRTLYNTLFHLRVSFLENAGKQAREKVLCFSWELDEVT